MNNVHPDGYNDGGADRNKLIIKIIVIISIIAIGAFLWIVSREDFAWKKTKTEVPYKHATKMAVK